MLALYYFYAVWRFPKCERGALVAFPAPAVQGNEERVTATLHTESNHRLVGDDYRPHAQTVGRYCSEGKDVGAWDNDRPAYRKGVGCGTCWRAHHKTVGLVGRQVFAVDAGMNGNHRGVVALEYCHVV